MSKSIIFLADGMADIPIKSLNNKTPLEFANTPNMDYIAEKGASGTFLSLPDGFPTSSDVANMSVLGYDLAKYYPGRGPIEAVSQGIDLKNNEIAWRCNLITVKNDKIYDYSAGHIKEDIAQQLISDIQKEFGNDKVSFVSGVSYRNLLILHGDEFSTDIEYAKPDSSFGANIYEIELKPRNNSDKAIYTTQFLKTLIAKVALFLEKHPLNKNNKTPANYIWPWSPGHKPMFPKFSDKYGKSGAIITAVDVISGIGLCSEMTVIPVEGATGFIDTNYQGKVDAAVKALQTHDFVYLHVEAIDECSHLGDLDLKLQAIEDFDSKIVAPTMKALKGQDVTYAVLPDHPVPIALRKHTRTPVPFSICGPRINPDLIMKYTENEALKGAIGFLKADELIRLVLQ